MGVSFKVSKAGTRYKPKLLPTEDKDHENGSVSDSQQRDSEVNSAGMGAKVADPSSIRVKSGRHSVSDDLEVSFSLNLFQNGFSVGKANELFNDVPKQLHPYDRASKTLFSAIECGWLPGDIFDDLPCKYVNGAILCEIKDYRGCLIQGRGTGCTEKFPNVHKVLLHMRMENVVKDILSISDDSWTYRDLLEVESHILKALQPDLHLNPQPLQDRYSGEPLTKKVNLGIMWSWKKRKLSDASNSGLDLGNSYHVTDIPANCATQNCSSLLDLSYQERGVTFLEENVSTSSVNPQGNNILLENSQSNPLTPQPKYKVGDSCNQSVLTVMTTSNVVSVSKRSLTDSNNDLSKPSSTVLSERGRCETLEVQGPLLKKPKQEPVDISYQQLTGSQTENSLKPYLQWNNKLMHQRTEDEKVLHKRFQDKVHPSLVINNCQTKSFLGISEMQAGVATSVKLEPAQASFPNSNARMIKDNLCVMDRRLIQSKLLQSQKPQSSPLLRDNIPTDTSLNCLVQPVDKNIRNRSVTQMRKGLEKCQLMTGERHASASSQNINSLPREVSVPVKLKKNPHPKCSSIKIVDSSASMSNVNAANATHISTSLTSPQPLEVEVDSFLERLLKIQAVTKRYGLHNRKCKLDKFLKKQPFFPITPLVAFQLVASNDHNGKLENTSTDKISLSECSMDWEIGICKTRTLTFLRKSHIHGGNEIPMVDREAQVRLVISLKLNEGRVDASVLYGIEEDVFSIDYPLLPGFPSSHSANLLATQFTSLMVHEGYYLASDQVEPTPLKVDGGLSSQWRSVNISGIATPSARTIGLPSTSTLNQGLSPFRLRPMSSIMSSHNSMQLLSHNIFSGGQSLPTENTQFKQPLYSAAQVNFMRLQLQQQIQNKRANLLYQSLQRQKQQNELAQRRSMVGGLGATAGGLGMIQQGGGIQGLGNVGFGSFGNAIGMRSSTPPMALGGQTWMGNVGQFNNLGRKISGLNDSKLLGLISDPSAAFLSQLRAAEGQGKALMSGVPVQRNAGEVPMQYISNITDMTCKLSNQKQLQLQMHQPEMRSLPQQSQQNIVQQQQEMMPLPQHLEATSLAQHVGSPQSHVSSHQQFDQLPPVSQQLSLESALQQVNVMVGYGSPELSSHTHGSMGSNKM